MVPRQLKNSRLGFINPGLTLIRIIYGTYGKFGSSKPLLVDGDSHVIGIFTIKVWGYKMIYMDV